MNAIANEIFSSLVRDLFDRPIMGNLYRPHYVERMVALGLGEGFRLMSADWSGWDIEGGDGLRIEVKQSAARQTWTDRTSLEGRTTPGSFDIAPRTGYWAEGGTKWVPKPGRHAHVYILAWHPVSEVSKADQRDPTQWRFFVVPSKDLPPDQKSIARTVVEKRWPPVGFHRLREFTLKTAQEVLWQ
jgi:hypothetical protein